MLLTTSSYILNLRVLGVETTWPGFEGTDVLALGGPTEVAPVPPAVHMGKQGGKTKGGAGVVSTK